MTTKNQNENPVFFVDQNRLTIAKAEVSGFCMLANDILSDLIQFEVNAPNEIEQAKELIFAGTDKIKQIIIDNQLDKMKSLPPAAAAKLVSLPADSLDILGRKLYSLQNKHSAAKINHTDFLTFANGCFAVDAQKLERYMTVYRTEAITEAERLVNEFIQSFETLKTYCSEHGYCGAILDYDGIIHQNGDEFLINPLGFQYFE